jgi:hypothetical protein
MFYIEKTINTVSLSTTRHKLFLLFFFVALFSLCNQANAQFAVSMGLDRSSYLLHEPVFTKIFFRNYSGRGLIFGATKELKGNLEFVVHGPDGKILKPYNNKLDPFRGIIVNPGASDEVIVPLSRIYHFPKAGNYSIKAILSHPQMEKSYQSKTGGFSVFNGIVVWQRIVGIPDVMNLDSKSKIKTRTVKVLSFYDGKKKMFALRIEDYKYIYGVIRLADDIGNKPPQCEIDGLSRIHVLAQISPKVFSYYVYDMNCRLEEKANFMRSDQVNPRLVRNPKQGTVMVVGGRKAVKGRDFIEEDYNPMFIEGNKNKNE